MNSIMLFNKANVVITECLKVKPNEEILIVVDETLSKDLVSAFKIAASNVGAKPHVLSYTPDRFTPLKEYCVFGGTSMRDYELPKTVLAAMKGADAIIMLISDMDSFFSTTLKKELGYRRIIFMQYITEESFLRLFPSSSQEVISLKETVEKVAKCFKESHEAKITSPQGTNIVMELGEYGIFPQTGISEPGILQVLPGGQVSTIPNDGSAEGTLVIDRSIAAQEYKVLQEPIVLQVEKGCVVDIKGGTDAKSLKRFLEELKDPNIYHVTELAMGLNQRCKFAGIAAPTEDTHIIGCVSMALGCDIQIGGKNKAAAHIEMTMMFPTLTLDGKIIVEDGKLNI